MDISVKCKVPCRHRFYETTFYCPCHNYSMWSLWKRESQDCYQPAVFGLTYQCLGGCHQPLQAVTALKLAHHICQHQKLSFCQNEGNSKSVWNRLWLYNIGHKSSTAENVLRMTKSCLWKTWCTFRLCPSEEAGLKQVWWALRLGKAKKPRLQKAKKQVLVMCLLWISSHYFCLCAVSSGGILWLEFE